jgi:DNA-binding MarR family transcriptional regulator
MAVRTSPPKGLNAAEMRAWRTLIKSTTSLLAVLDNELQAEHGLTLGEYEVLVVLSEAPEHTLRMSDLAEHLLLSPSGITRRIDGLVRDGLVERQRCPSDRRGLNAVLTAKGMARLETAAPTHVRGVREHFVDQLSERQLANLAAALGAVSVDRNAAAGGCDVA